MSYRILSLDGGGTWALIQAMALNDLYPGKSGLQILGDFDLAVANSGGSIVLAGLMLDKTPQAIINMFNDEPFRRGIFHRRHWNDLGSWVSRFPRYSARDKAKGLEAAFGARGSIPLAKFVSANDWPKRAGKPTGILIAAFDRSRMRETFFRTYTISGVTTLTTDISLRDAVHASSNAPILYFDEPAIANVDGASRTFWDGAMGAYNNPVMAAVVDALALGIEPGQIQILSIGTGTVRRLPQDVAKQASPAPAKGLVEASLPGFAGDFVAFTKCLNADPPDSATYTAHIVTANPVDKVDRLVRMNPVVSPVSVPGANGKMVWSYPTQFDQASFDALVKLDMDLVAPKDVQRIADLADAWLKRKLANQLIRTSATFNAGLGDATYDDAKARWQKLS